LGFPCDEYEEDVFPEELLEDAGLRKAIADDKFIPMSDMASMSADEWNAACKGGPAPPSNFELQSPVTEAFLLGGLATHLPGERLEWDTANMRFTNSERANAYVDPPYRGEYRI
jgi:hypothetical protein